MVTNATTHVSRLISCIMIENETCDGYFYYFYVNFIGSRNVKKFTSLARERGKSIKYNIELSFRNN